MEQISKVVIRALLLCGCWPAFAQPANPLLGKWKAEASGFKDRDGYAPWAAIPELDFAPTSQTMYTVGSEPKLTDRVTYFVGGPTVYVLFPRGTGGGIKYTMLNQNEMLAHGCKYKRS